VSEAFGGFHGRSPQAAERRSVKPQQSYWARKMTREKFQRKDVWAAGDLYEPYVGRWSRLVAQEFLTWLTVPEKNDWLDVGCGTGALTQTILDYKSPQSVTGVDPSAGYIEYAKTHVNRDRATFEVGDAQSLPIDGQTVDAAVAGLVLNFVPQPLRAVAEMGRVVRPGGVVAAYVWDYAGKMELMRYFWDAAAALDPVGRDLDEGRRFPICQPDPLNELFAEAGLRDVEVRAIDVPTTFRNFDDYWSPFLGGQGPAPGYAISLREAKRDVLRDRIRSKLPMGKDGTIRLIARAWAVRGSVP
jgi:SAM-dependent methyltransferase